MARGLKFRIMEVEGLYHPYSENKGTDQLRGYREADLRLCFRICKKPFFSQRGSNIAELLLLIDICQFTCFIDGLLVSLWASMLAHAKFSFMP